MCGIVAVFDYLSTGRRVDPGVFDSVVDTLAHRGPDGRGTWHDGPVSLGHRRLAILDPTEAGSQPMVHTSGDFVVTYNGEIYNFRQLRTELEELGHSFRTNCDTEVLLAAYAQWGTEAVTRLNGIFAFALWDGRRRRLWMARDRLGVKPLFYSTADGLLRAASEPKAIVADPAFPRRPSREAINAFLSFGYVPSPMNGFEGVLQLPPGSEAVVSGGEVSVRPYWQLSMGEVSMSYDDALGQFADRLQAAVARQMVSDVPISGFLSGGVDSAAVVSRMAAAGQQTVRSFSVSFQDASFDEAPQAARTAGLIGTDHTEVQVEFDLLDTLDRMIDHCEDPFADSSSLAVYHLCRVAREHVSVALSGDGADELLAGYSTYPATELARWYRLLPSPARSAVRGLVGRIPASDRRYSFQQFADRFARGAEEGQGGDFASWRVHLDRAQKELVGRRGYFDGLPNPIESYAERYHQAPDAQNRLKRMLWADLSFYLPADMLVKVDRMSMAHGLEVRVPFLDHELVEFCAGLPERYLRRHRSRGPGKRILRDYLRQQLGPQVAGRSKRGFNVPVEKAMRTVLWDRFHEAVNEPGFRDSGPFDVERLEAFAERHRQREIDAGHALFSIMVLALWWSRWF